MQIPHEDLLHSTEEADILTEFEFRVMEEGVYHEPQIFLDGPIDNEFFTSDAGMGNQRHGLPCYNQTYRHSSSTSTTT